MSLWAKRKAWRVSAVLQKIVLQKNESHLLHPSQSDIFFGAAALCFFFGTAAPHFLLKFQRFSPLSASARRFRACEVCR